MRGDQLLALALLLEEPLLLKSDRGFIASLVQCRSDMWSLVLVIY